MWYWVEELFMRIAVLMPLASVVLLVLAGVLMVVLIWKAVRYRGPDSGAQYQALADRSVTAAEATERTLRDLTNELERMRVHLASLDRVVSEVE